MAVLALGVAGAAVLVVAEFTPLLKVHSALQRAPVASVKTGSHDSYALVPIAVLAAFFSVAVWRTGHRLYMLATGVLGLAALLIALIGDLPDAQATGILGGVFAVAKATPSVGFYLETLGAALLLIACGAGLLLLAPPPWPGHRRPREPEVSQGPLPD